DRADAGEHLEGALQLVFGDGLNRGLKLVQQQLHPQLADLVLDDEEHLVVSAGAALLRPEHDVEMQVVAVAHVAAEVDFRAGAGFAGLVRHHVTAARRPKRGSRQMALASTSAMASAASQASTKRGESGVKAKRRRMGSP